MNNKPSVRQVVKNIGSVALLFTLTKMDSAQALSVSVEAQSAAAVDA
jgi:hypothetical protein